MEIKETNLKFNGLSDIKERKQTNFIVIHHSASKEDLTVEEIHKYHRDQLGWAGIGYHFYIRKDGKIYRGRPEQKSGAHTEPYFDKKQNKEIGVNSSSIGICLSGNFEIEQPTEKQLKALKEIIGYLRTKYPNAEIVGHRDLNATTCPGKNLYSKLGSVIANSITPKDEYVKVFMTNNKLSVVQSNGKKFTYNIPKGTTKEDFIVDLAHGLKITK